VHRVEIDRNGLEVLDRSECLMLLGRSYFGRVGVTDRALPTVLPVNYRLVGDRVVFRTGEGSKLDAATRGAVVAFEVDAVDPVTHTGWSVVVTGVAREVTDPADLAALQGTGLPRWATCGDGRVVAIDTAVVSGRRITGGPAPR
jgi:nitroimidazol reductase NimA-like FMN-containing flavoprotein (pyridoxamine 5'-phosphate oxidase superfamily)